MVTKEIKIKELSERKVAFVSYTGNYMGNPEIFAGLFGKLFAWAGPKGLLNQNLVMLSSYENNPKITPLDELKLDVCMEIPENICVCKDGGEIKKKVLPGGKYVTMYAELKSPEEYGLAWNKVVEWMKKNKHEIDMSRPSYEIYLNNPEEHPEKHHFIDICMSAK